MKFENKQPLPEEIKLHSQKQIEKQHKLVNQIIPFKGHTLFEINCTTGKIEEPEYEMVAADYQEAVNGEDGKRRKIIVKENCLYISCLNKTNAKKKFLKYLLENARVKCQ